MGWGVILYFVVLIIIDDFLYEVVWIDGVNCWKQMIYVIILGILLMIVILLILNMGNFFVVGFEKIFFFYNLFIYDILDVIFIYLYCVGL